MKNLLFYTYTIKLQMVNLTWPKKWIIVPIFLYTLGKTYICGHQQKKHGNDRLESLEANIYRQHNGGWSAMSNDMTSTK